MAGIRPPPYVPPGYVALIRASPAGTYGAGSQSPGLACVSGSSDQLVSLCSGELREEVDASAAPTVQGSRDVAPDLGARPLAGLGEVTLRIGQHLICAVVAIAAGGD